MVIDYTALLAAMCIPSAITGFCFWLIERRITKRDEAVNADRKRRQEISDRREANREAYELCLLNSVNAAIALGEATAKAVQRIPDAHCNGDMHGALDYAEEMKHAQKDFLNKQAIEAMQD